ncbi:MAG: hypothetical protein ACLFVU_01475 [Phycisphaerae bacterium]
MRTTAVAAVTLLAIGLGVCGCAVTQQQDTPVSQRYETDPVTGRGFYLYVPSTYSHETLAKLIVTCHGTPPYDVAEHHIREWKMLGEKNGCIVIAPKLVGTDGIFGSGPVGAMLRDEQWILSIISTLGYRYNIDRNNIMITGFSGGGFPTYWVGLRNPEIFSVVVARSTNFNANALNGWYSPSAKKTPVLVYRGENDPATIIDQSNKADAWLEENGFSHEYRVIQGLGHERRPEIAMEFFRNHWKTPQPTLGGK